MSFSSKSYRGIDGRCQSCWLGVRRPKPLPPPGGGALPTAVRKDFHVHTHSHLLVIWGRGTLEPIRWGIREKLMFYSKFVLVNVSSRRPHTRPVGELVSERPLHPAPHCACSCRLTEGAGKRPYFSSSVHVLSTS